MTSQDFPYIARKIVGDIQFVMEVGSIMEQAVVDGIYFEKGVLEEMISCIRTGDIVYDVGSSTGTHTIPAAIKSGHNGRVYSFEPDHECADVLRYNVLLNRLENVKVLENALWDKDCVLVVHSGGREGYAPQVTEKHQQPRAHVEYLSNHYEIPSRSIESLVRYGDLEPPDILKIDVEGAGLFVLKGLGQVRPREIFIEVHPSLGESRKEIVSLLNDRGYELIAESSRADEIHLHFQI